MRSIPGIVFIGPAATIPSAARSENVAISGATAVRIGNGKQNVLWRSGDDVRID